MRRILVAALVTAALTAGAPAASADHRHAGGCGYTTADDRSGTGADTRWRGMVDVVARTIDVRGMPTVEPITVACELFVNGYSHGIVARASGTGVVAHVEELSYTADHDDRVSMCWHVEVSGSGYYDCGGYGAPFPWPDPAPVIDLLNEHVFGPVDPAVCGVLAAHAGRHGPILIEEGGDVYLFGEEYYDRYWDCPPYAAPS